MSPIEIDQVLRTGYALQQAGQLSQAETLYRQVFAQHPNHDGALSLLGGLAIQANRADLAVQFLRRATAVQPLNAVYHSNLGFALQRQGKVADAMACFRRAVELQPDFADAHCNLGNALFDLGRLEEAVASCRTALALKPGFPVAHNGLGNALHGLGRLDEAASAYRHALALAPDFVDANHGLGVIGLKQGKLDEAIACFRRTVALQPDHAASHNNLGLALQRQGKRDEAVACMRKALELKPAAAEFHNNLGVTLVEQGKNDEALICFRRALERQPAYAEAYCGLGNVLQGQGKTDEAIACFRQSVQLKPSYADAHYNLGTALTLEGKLEEAIACYRRALELDPGFAKAHKNLAGAFHAQGKFAEAETHYDAAIRLDPDFGDAYGNRSLLWLLRGDFERGLVDYEWRRKTQGSSPGPRPVTQPQWDGTPLNGQTILLHAEQGFGDTLHFIRYASLAAQAGGNVIVECQPPLQRLLKNNLRSISVIGKGAALPPFDVQCPLPSLPLACRTTLRTIPRDVPYVHADAELAAKWRSRLVDDDGRAKIGLVWAGNRRNPNDRNRSMALANLAPLSQVPHVRYYSLQKGEAAVAPIAGLPLIDWTDEFADFADTAALIANLDLVISVDTAVAHLAGAMAKPVWTLLPFVPDWRWLLDRADSPWYPTMRLFRQPAAGDWSSVVARVVDALCRSGPA